MIKEELLNEAKMIDKIYKALSTIPEFSNAKVGADVQGEISMAVEKILKMHKIRNEGHSQMKKSEQIAMIEEELLKYKKAAGITIAEAGDKELNKAGSKLIDLINDWMKTWYKFSDMSRSVMDAAEKYSSINYDTNNWWGIADPPPSDKSVDAALDDVYDMAKDMDKSIAKLDKAMKKTF